MLERGKEDKMREAGVAKKLRGGGVMPERGREDEMGGVAKKLRGVYRRG